MITDPALTPVTVPELFTEAMEALLVLHVPPLVVSTKTVLKPAQTDEAPVILPAEGAALTVIDLVATAVPQIPVTEYEIVTVPAATGITIPPVLTVANDGLLLVQVPPDTELVRVIVVPVQAVEAPDIVPAFGEAFTTILLVTVIVPQLPVTA